MPVELQIIRAREFIRLGAHGKYDLKASKAALADLAAACCKRGINQALVDLRGVQFGPKPVFSPKDLSVLLNTFHEMGFTRRQRLAVLYRVDPHQRARLFAFFAKMRGWRVNAFDNFEKAITWLSGANSEESETETEYTGRAKKVPIRKVKHLKASSKPISPPTIPIKSKLALGAVQLKPGKRLVTSTRAAAIPVMAPRE